MRFLIVALLAAQAASAPQTTFRSGVEVVELDVSVTRGGVPVAGLTARDFALTDNGVAQDVAQRHARAAAAQRDAGARHQPERRRRAAAASRPGRHRPDHGAAWPAIARR